MDLISSQIIIGVNPEIPPDWNQIMLTKSPKSFIVTNNVQTEARSNFIDLCQTSLEALLRTDFFVTLQ